MAVRFLAHSPDPRTRSLCPATRLPPHPPHVLVCDATDLPIAATDGALPLRCQYDRSLVATSVDQSAYLWIDTNLHVMWDMSGCWDGNRPLFLFFLLHLNEIPIDIRVCYVYACWNLIKHA